MPLANQCSLHFNPLACYSKRVIGVLPMLELISRVHKPHMSLLEAGWDLSAGKELEVSSKYITNVNQLQWEVLCVPCDS